MQVKQEQMRKCYSRSLKKMLAEKLIHSSGELKQESLRKNLSSLQEVKKIKQLQQMQNGKRNYFQMIDKVIKKYSEKERLSINMSRLIKKKKYNNYRIQTQESSIDEDKSLQLPKIKSQPNSKFIRYRNQFEDYNKKKQNKQILNNMRQYRGNLKQRSQIKYLLKINQSNAKNVNNGYSY